MSIKNDLNKILSIKSNIRTEIVNKNVTIPNDTPLEQYPEKVNKIEPPASTVCCILKVEPTPNDATVTFTDLPNFQNQASVIQSNSIEYTVSKEGYTSITNSEVMDVSKSVQVTLPHSPVNVVKAFHTITGIMLLTDTGDLWATGGYQNGNKITNAALKIGSNVKDMWDKVYLTNDGKLYGKGSTSYNILGSAEGSTTWKQFVSGVKDFYTNGYSAGYITTNNDLYLCGINTYGQQGSGNTTNVTTYTKRASNVRKVITNNYGTLYITTSNDLYGCGHPYCLGINASNTDPVKTFAKRYSNVLNAELFGKTTGALLETTGHLLYATGGMVQQQGESTYHTNWLLCCSNVKGYDASESFFYIDGSYNLYASASAQSPTGDGVQYTYIKKIREGVRKIQGKYRVSLCIGTDDKLYTVAYSSGSINGNNYGQQGTGDYRAHTTWTYVMDDVTDLANDSSSQSSVILKNGVCYACGYNSSKALGTGLTDSSIPTFTPVIFDYQD